MLGGGEKSISASPIMTGMGVGVGCWFGVLLLHGHCGIFGSSL